MLNDNLLPIWQPDSSDSLVDLAMQLKALAQGKSDNTAAAIEVWHQVILLSQAELKALQPPHSSTASLFEQDYCAWVKQQLRLLHLQQFDQLDLEHLPDELDSLAWLVQRQIDTNLETICNHLLKYQYAREYLNDEPCCNSWRSTLLRARQQIGNELEDSPSLEDYPAQELDELYHLAALQVYRETKLPDDTLPQNCPWTVNQVLDKDWLPAEGEIVQMKENNEQSER